MNRNPSRLLAFLAVVLLAACSADPGSSSGGSPSEPPLPSASTIPSDSASVSSSPSESESAEASPSEAASGPTDSIVVARIDGLRVRETPGLDATEIGTLDSGYESLVVDGPEVADGLEWYLISGLGLPPASGCSTGPDPTHPFDCPVWLGWAARASADGTAWLEETEPECADPAGPLDDFAFQPRYLHIACYGDEVLTLRGYLRAAPAMSPAELCPDIPEELRWLGCLSPAYQLVSTADGTIGLPIGIPPGAAAPDTTGEVVLEGHFDDPAAAACTYGDEPERSILDCRSQFVMDSAGGG